MTRGEIWLAEAGRKVRPVLIVTRAPVIDVRQLVTVAEVSTTIRGLSSEVAIDYEDVGLDEPSVINCDGLHTIAQSSLTRRVGAVDEAVLDRVCAAIAYAVGC